GDGEVTLADQRLGAFRQLDAGDVDGAVDVEAGEIGFDRIRNVVSRAEHQHFVADDVQHAALLDAGRGVVVLEANRNFDLHPGAFFEAHEIDMDGAVGDRIDLHGA